jgi:hypothetical protein
VDSGVLHLISRGRIDCEIFSLHLDFLVLRIMHCVNTK